MSCLKAGAECDHEKKTWCNGFTCQHGMIVEDEQKRKKGEMCATSTDCEALNCTKPDCDVLTTLGVSSHICNRMGVCSNPA